MCRKCRSEEEWNPTKIKFGVGKREKTTFELKNLNLAELIDWHELMNEFWVG